MSILRSRGVGSGATFLGFKGDLDEVLASYRYKVIVDQIRSLNRSIAEWKKTMGSRVRSWKGTTCT